MAEKSVRYVKMPIRSDKKHSVRFDNADDNLLRSVYLSREGLINTFGTDQMSGVLITVEVLEN